MMPNAYVRMLVRQETRKLLLPALLTGILFAFLGAVTGTMFLGLGDADRMQGAARVVGNIAADLVTVSMTCTLGFVFTRDYLSFYWSDAFSRRLAFYRKLPVTDKEIVAARYLVFLITIPPMALCYFAGMYVPVQWEHLVTGTEFVQAALVWLGISLAGGSGFMYMEQGMPGKAYMELTLLVVFGLLLAVVVLNLSGIHLVGGSVALVRSWGIGASVAGIAAGGAVAWGVAPLIVRRLASRDLI